MRPKHLIKIPAPLHIVTLGNKFQHEFWAPIHVESLLCPRKLDSLLPGTAQKRRARETALYSSALVTNERVGRRLPDLQMKEEELRHQKAVSTMTVFRADWVLIQ